MTAGSQGSWSELLRAPTTTAKNSGAVSSSRVGLAIVIGVVDHHGVGIERVDDVVEVPLEIGIGGLAGAIGRAAVEHGFQARELVRGQLLQRIHLRRVDRVEHGAAHAFRVVAHDREREARAVRDAVEVPLLVAEGLSQGLHVRGRLAAIEEGQVDALGEQLVTAGSQSGFILRPVELIDLARAVEQGDRPAGATLVEEDQVAVVEERVAAPAVEVGDGLAAGAALQVDDGVGLRLVGLRSRGWPRPGRWWGRPDRRGPRARSGSRSRRSRPRPHRAASRPGTRCRRRCRPGPAPAGRPPTAGSPG